MVRSFRHDLTLGRNGLMVEGKRLSWTWQWKIGTQAENYKYRILLNPVSCWTGVSIYVPEQTLSIAGTLVSFNSGDPGTQKIDWSKQADSLRGRNGQRFTYYCPPGTVSSRLWGVDLYTDDSSICTAAVHAGLITAQSGGTVTIEIRAGANTYQGTTRNGVKSSRYGSWHGSFVFVGGSPPRPDLGNLWRIREANPQGQGCDGVWRRRAGTQIFDARWQCLGGTVVDVVRIESVTGTQVIVYREGNGGRYTLTLSPDGRRIISGRIGWAPGWTFTGTIE